MSMKEFERRLKSVCKTYKSKWDDRNYRVRSPLYEEVVDIPEEFDALIDFTRHYDQDGIGMCVGMSGQGTMETTNLIQDMECPVLSAWWCYMRSRKYANVPDYIEGSTNFGLMKALHKEGVLTEEFCPTPKSKGEVYDFEPNEVNLEMAGEYQISSYWYVNTTPNDFKAAIYGITHPASYKMPDDTRGKIPLIVAYPVYESFREAYDDGVVPLPIEGETLLGGHSSIIRGWKLIDGELYWINTNSWGSVGDACDFYLPKDYPFYDAWIIENEDVITPPVPKSIWCRWLGWLLPWLCR